MGRKSDARQRILDAALGLMRKKGYANVSIDDILQAAKVGKSSFYHFFESKEALGAEILKEHSKRLWEQILSAAFAPDISPLERPVRFIALLSHQPDAANGSLIGIAAAEHPFNSDFLTQQTYNLWKSSTQLVEETFNQAINEMELLPGTPVEELAQATIAYMEGVQMLCRLTQSNEPIEKLGPLVSNLWKPYRV
jgi:TetR/AcrR family transcriptional repressor of nem operon